MKTLVLVAALTGGVAMLTGCQMSGDRHVDTSRRPARVDNYMLSYRATQDTEWRSTTDTNADRGTLRRGSTVRFERAPNTSAQWQQAVLDDNSIRYVRPSDFTPTDGAVDIR